MIPWFVPPLAIGAAITAAAAGVERSRARIEPWLLFALGAVFAFPAALLFAFAADAAPHESHVPYGAFGEWYFAFNAVIYYGWPALTGRALDRSVGAVHFWFAFVSYAALVVPLRGEGLAGTGAPSPDVTATLAASSLLLSSLILPANILWSAFRRPAAAR